MGSQVPSSKFQVPTHVNKSQHGVEVPTYEVEETIKIWLILINVGF